MRRRWRVLVAAGAVEAVLAMGVAGQPRVVVSREPLWPAGRAWHLGEVPVLELGSSGHPLEEFGDIQALARLDDGTVLVVDRMAGEVRLFDGSGRFLRSVGRLGEGPGEFNAVGRIQLLGADTFAVFDPTLRRWTAFTAEGARVASRTFRSGVLPGVGRAYRHRDGDFTLTGSVLLGRGGETGYFDVPLPLFAYQVEGDRYLPLGEVPGRQFYRTRSGALGRALVLRPGALALGEERVYAGDGAEWEIRVLDREGRILELWRRDGVDLSLSVARLRTAERRSLERLGEHPEAMARWRRLYAEVPPPASLPAFGAFVLDSDGFLWVEAFALVGEAAPPWSVFDPMGGYLGDVIMPERFSLMAVRGPWAVGVWRDDLDVPHVRIYEILGRR